jgi:hypothetical protein
MRKIIAMDLTPEAEKEFRKKLIDSFILEGGLKNVHRTNER